MSAEATPPPEEEDTYKEDRALSKVSASILCAIIIIIGALAFTALKKFAPQAEETEPLKVIPAVEVVTASPDTASLTVASQGSVMARTETQAASEVSGRVISVADNFETGAAFKEGDVLLTIDDADYIAALATSRAEEADAALAVATEKARAAQAQRDWKRLGTTGKKPTDLVLRKPQMVSAEARLEASKAAVSRAQRNLDRTRLRAPYDGRIRSTATDVGSYVTVGSPLAEMYATDRLEVMLPLSSEDFAFIEKNPGTEITLRSRGETIGATLSRISGEVDTKTRQVSVIAALPEDSKLLPGEFVTAEITGITLDNTIAIPRRALYGTGQVLSVDNDDRLRFRDVTVARTSGETVYISDGVSSGDRIATTTLAAPVDGMEVQVISPAEGNSKQ